MKTFAEKRFFKWQQDDVSVSLRCRSGSYGGGSEVLVVYGSSGQEETKMWKYWNGGTTAGTLSARNAGGGQRMPDKEHFNCLVREEPTPGINRGIAGTLDGSYYKGCGERQGIEREIVASEMEDSKYVVRRLTPTECARLQGFPDRWGWPYVLDDMDEKTFEFWKTVRQTHDSINGRPQKDYTKKQILTWYNKLHTDSSEYKMWGNGIALPTALYVMQGIADELGDGGDEQQK